MWLKHIFTSQPGHQVSSVRNFVSYLNINGKSSASLYRWYAIGISNRNTCSRNYYEIHANAM